MAAAPPSPRSRAGVRPLPLDALYEVLLRVPAKDLCRLRAVCRPWRSLLSDPHFVAAHAGRHPEPLIVAAPRRPGRSPPGHLLDIMDLSGRVIKRVVKPGSLWATSKKWGMTAQLDVVLLAASQSCLVLNPATGAVSALPEGFAEEHSPHRPNTFKYRQLLAVGKVASTGEYKMLRVLRRYHPPQHNRQQLCEVFTIDGSSNARWRRKKGPPTVWVLTHSLCTVTINGIVYFLSFKLDGVVQEGCPIHVASFDLETEEWRPIFQGPTNLEWYLSSLASLNGCLVMIHHTECSADLWFLMDFENDLWAKQHSIPVKSGLSNDKISVWPLLVLNDGRILFYEAMGLLRIYDPKSCACTDGVEIGPRSEIGLYTGSLLSLPDGASAQL